jgi:hypothetical protein
VCDALLAKRVYLEKLVLASLVGVVVPHLVKRVSMGLVSFQVPSCSKVFENFYVRLLSMVSLPIELVLNLV